jgi:hypothetical protein
MQIIYENPQIDDVIKAHIRANGHEIEQKDSYNDAFEIYSCFKEFDTANFETQNSEVTEIGLQIFTGWTAEPCFCPLVQEDWN